MAKKSPIDVLIEKCPTIIHLISTDRRFWRNQLKRHDQRQNHFLELSQNGLVKFPDTSFIDLAVRASNGENQYGDFLNFIDQNLRTILDNSPAHFLPEIRQKVRSMISGFELNRANFLDWAGEIFTHALYILESNTIVDIETKLPNGKRVDLKITKDNNCPRLVEIVNINLIEKETVSEVKLSEFIDGKISQKISEKFDNLDIKELNPFLQVVVWASESFIQKHKMIFLNYRNNKIEHQFSFLLARSNREKEMSAFEFGSISVILEKLDKH